MSRKTQKFQLGPEVYEITQLGTELGVPLGHRLMKALAPSVRDLVTEIAGSDAKTLQAAIGQLGEVGVAIKLVQAFEGAPTDLLVELGKTFAQVTTVKSSTLMLPLDGLYDDHFAGRFDHWMQWVFCCVKFNFGASFLGRLASSGATPTPAGQPSQENQPSA